MTLNGVAKQELKTHMDIELSRNQLTPAAQMELETHTDIELSRNRLTPRMEPHMKLELGSSYSVISYYASN